MELIIGVVIIIVLVRFNSRIKAVEEALKAKGTIPSVPAVTPMYSSITEIAPQGAAMHTAASSPVARPYVAPVAQPAPVVPAGPSVGARLSAWFREDWLMKLGALLLLIGFGWLTTYAFLHNWIGPMGRITLGIAGGLLILVFGWYRMRTHVHQGGICTVLGATVVLLTIFAAREVYSFFTPMTALVIMFGTTVFVGLASSMYKAQWVALCGLILASLAPFLTASPQNHVVLFTYLLVVTLATLWLVAVRGWRALVTTALVIVAIHSGPILIGLVSADRETLLLIMYAFAALFFVFSTIGIVKAKTGDITADIVTVGGSGLLLLWWILKVATPELQSLIIVAWMIVFLVGAFMMTKATGDKRPFYVYAGVSIAMLGAATAAELSGAALVIAFAVEVTALYLTAHALVHDSQRIEALAFLFIVPISLSMPSIMSSAWRTGVIHKDFFVLLTIAIGLFVIFLVRQWRDDGKKASDADSVLSFVGAVYVYILIWRSLHAFFLGAQDLATMASLIIYTVIGITCYFAGARQARKSLRLHGGLLLVFVVGRLLVVDVWQMELTGRIITFFVIGILLMCTAFFGKKKVVETLPHITV